MMLEKIRARAKEYPGAQKDMASKFGCSPQYINDLVHGRRSITDAAAIPLGYRKVVIFVPMDGEEGE
jgi:plasmid maintenance system antidote protein VapI